MGREGLVRIHRIEGDGRYDGELGVTLTSETVALPCGLWDSSSANRERELKFERGVGGVTKLVDEFFSLRRAHQAGRGARIGMTFLS